ncbi:hypothetical protein LJR231_002637 [Phyllobacterium sp. LjRoot231]|uniref:hypothetical protein n=1 Tax=Phyllobacterium sp. LjRoot231 TaxID=3342289 RepID=UPI003ECCFE25
MVGVVEVVAMAEAEKVAGAMAEVERAAAEKVEVEKEEAVAGKTATTATLGQVDPTAFLARRPLVPAQPDASSL